MSTPFVSVIIVNFNGARLLPDCLHAIFSSSYDKRNFEVIVVDNNSTDTSVQLLATDFPTVRVHKLPQNLGFGAANNHGAEVAKGEILLFVNTDTIVSPTWMEILAKRVMDETIGAVNPKVLLSSKPAKVQNAGITVFANGGARDRGAIVSLDKQQDYEEDSTFFDTPIDVGAVCGVSLCMRKDVFMHAGGFNELFFFYYEDVELSLRLRRLGYRLVYEPQATLIHLHAATSKENSLFFLRHSEQGMLLCTYIHYPFTACLLVTGRYMVRIAASLFRSLLFVWRGRNDSAQTWIQRTFIRMHVLLFTIAQIGEIVGQRTNLAHKEKQSLAQLYETFS